MVEMIDVANCVVKCIRAMNKNGQNFYNSTIEEFFAVARKIGEETENPPQNREAPTELP
jgi:hypothetical protein